ncbi:MAG TPA: thioesterase family protein [Xanthobacteraceae bacterium]|jgi:4-hydroxybenzoyl-CoA thioesterase
MGSLINRRQFSLEWGHCDPAGIAFNGRFFEFFDWGTWALFEAALGVKPAGMAAAYGLPSQPLMPLVEVSAQFLAAVRFGDVMEMTSQVREFRRSSFDVEHRISVGTALAVTGLEKRVWVIRDAADPSVIKARPMAAEIIKRFEVQ